MRRLGNLIMNILYSIALFLCLLFVLIISIPLAIICTITWLLYNGFEYIHLGFKAFWLWLLDMFSKFIRLNKKTVKEDKKYDVK